MSYCQSFNKENKDRLSSFGQRLQSLSDTFYSTILEDSKDKKAVIKTAEELECLRESNCDDFTFDEYSPSRMTSTDNFSFTFHSIDQPKVQTSRKHQTKQRINHSSTPYSIREENLTKKNEEQTVIVQETRPQAIIVGYYPVISYQPVCLPPTIYLSKEQIQSQLNDYSTLNKGTAIKKV